MQDNKNHMLETWSTNAKYFKEEQYLHQGPFLFW